MKTDTFYVVTHGTNIRIFEIKTHKSGNLSVRCIRLGNKNQNMSGEEIWFKDTPFIALIGYGIFFYTSNESERDLENPISKTANIVGLFINLDDATKCFEEMRDVADGQSTSGTDYWFDERWENKSAETITELAPGGPTLFVVEQEDGFMFPITITVAFQEWRK